MNEQLRHKHIDSRTGINMDELPNTDRTSKKLQTNHIKMKADELTQDDFSNENCCDDCVDSNYNSSEKIQDGKLEDEFNLFNKNGEMNFVKAGRNEILNFIQKTIRTKNKLEKELELIQTDYDDEILDQKVKLLQSEDIKSLGAAKERELAVEKELQNVGTEYLNKLSELKDKVYSINNELNLAREIYKLKSLVV